MARKILITGAEGQLGKALQIGFNDKFNILPTTRQPTLLAKNQRNVQKLDVTDKENISNVLNSFKPDIIINCAAYTNVDDSEINKDSARQINVEGLQNLIQLSSEEADKVVKLLELIENHVRLTLSNKELGALEVDKVIFAVGRKPTSEGLFDPNLGIELEEQGFVKVNEFCQTDVPNIYAIGDLVRGPMLAHKASEEGVMVAEKIAGNNTRVNYKNIPFVIYTHPEIAWVGYSEKSAQKEGIRVQVGIFPFQANARALTSNEQSGFVKVVVNQEDDSIIGIHVLGPSAADVVQQGLIAMESNLTAEQLGSIMFSHPTVSEALHEAVLSSKGKAIHLNNRKRK